MNKHIVPIMVILLLVSSGFVGVSNTAEVDVERDELLDNRPPYVPNNYYPCSEPEPADIDVNLSWDGGDPDPGDTVTYDVYFGSYVPPPKVATVGPYPWNQTRIEYDPGMLEYCRGYYMRIVAYDNHGAIATGYICYFETNCPCSPEPPAIYGPTSGKVGVKYDYNFVSYNPECCEISYFIDWGDNTTTGWTDYYEAGEIITRNHTWYEEGNYAIKAKVKDRFGIESNWAYLKVTMPYSYHSNRWMGWLDRFPLLQRLLGWLIW